MKSYHIVLHEDRNVILDAYIHDLSPEYEKITHRPTMIVLPGGGYAMCSDREADNVAMEYLRAGFNACVLRYTLKSKGGWPLPLNDYDEVYELLCNKKDEWHIDTDRIAVIGFSAGGHLSMAAATCAKHRPAVALAGYPALAKKICDDCQPGMPYPAEHIDEKTPPIFLFASRDDSIVLIDGLLDFEKALFKNKINFESHIYPYGGHGFGTADKILNDGSMCKHNIQWIPNSLDFLADVWGEFTANGFTKPAIDRCVDGDLEEYLSTKCTYEHIRKQSAEVQEILEPLNKCIMALLKTKSNLELWDSIVGAYKIYELLIVFKLTALRDDMDAKLSKIKNIKD